MQIYKFFHVFSINYYLCTVRKRKGTGVLFFYCKKMDEKEIIGAITPVAESRGLFIVGVRLTKDNDITITVESVEGVVTLEDCEVLNRSFTGMFDQDKEDYSLTVTSAGLDGEFKVPAQYLKAVGSKVELWFKGGKKQIALLQGFDDEKIQTDCGEFARKEINKVKYHIEF